MTPDTTPQPENAFERVRDLVKQICPENLDKFDATAHRLHTFKKDEDIVVLLEATGWLTLLFERVAVGHFNSISQAGREHLEACQQVNKDLINAAKVTAEGTVYVQEELLNLQDAVRNVDRQVKRVYALKWGVFLLSWVLVFLVGFVTAKIFH